MTRSGLIRSGRYAGYFGLYVACAIGLVLQWGHIRPVHLAIGGISYGVRMFALAGVNHRYFAHRGYEMGRRCQFVLAVLGCIAVQRGPLWWSYSHDRHHRFSDTRRDPHSPWRQGLWLAHVHWLLDDKTWITDLDQVPLRFKRCRELVWLERYELVVILLFATTMYVTLGAGGLLWGYGISTLAIWQAMHAIGIFGHRFGGYRRYATAENSRNHWLLGLVTFGEGFHNNHHECPSSPRIGFFWYELDLAWYGLKLLATLGLVHDLREVPARIKHQHGRGLPRRRHALEASLGALESRLQVLHANLAGVVPESAPRRFEGAAVARIRVFADHGADYLHRGPAYFARRFSALRRGLRRLATPDDPSQVALARLFDTELVQFYAGCPFVREGSLDQAR